MLAAESVFIGGVGDWRRLCGVSVAPRRCAACMHTNACMHPCMHASTLSPKPMHARMHAWMHAFVGVYIQAPDCAGGASGEEGEASIGDESVECQRGHSDGDTRTQSHAKEKAPGTCMHAGLRHSWGLATQLITSSSGSSSSRFIISCYLSFIIIICLGLKY